MEIWAQTMVKNDARWLWFAVTSVISHVDKLLLWDTGSTDGTENICDMLKEKYDKKIIYKKRPQTSGSEFTKVRQEMLHETTADWFILVDGDEIWWRDSIKKVIETIHNKDNDIESIYVPTVNVVGDIFHYQEKSAGRYRFGKKIGHYNLRAVNKNITGLHSQGEHGVWGWADSENKMIQDRDPAKVFFVDAPYLHATFLPRAEERAFDEVVIKRSKKLKYDLGREFPLDYFYPEVFFEDFPNSIKSPWQIRGPAYKMRATIETPIRKLKRKFVTGKPGY